MTSTTFSNDEKKMLYSTVLEVGLAVMRASDSGFQGSVAELNAMVNAPLELAQQFANNSVIQAILPVDEPTDTAPDTENHDSEWIDEGATEIKVDALTMCQDAAD